MTENSGKRDLHVFFADDDSDEAYLFNEAIEQLGLSVSISKAQDGNHLMTILSSEEQPLPDLLFLDLNMPYKDGMETLKEIRANDRFKNMPVIIFSTSDNDIHTEACYKNGANLYIVKPETFDQILHIVKKIFSMDWKGENFIPTKENFVMKVAD